MVALHKRNTAGVPLFISTMALPVNLANPLSAAQHAQGPFASVSRVNQKIYEVATRSDGVHVLDLAWWAATEGRAHADATVDFLARQPLSAKGQVGFALFTARCLRPLVVPRRKVLAVDLDNTLWGGVVGEDKVQSRCRELKEPTTNVLVNSAVPRRHIAALYRSVLLPSVRVLGRTLRPFSTFSRPP